MRVCLWQLAFDLNTQGMLAVGADSAVQVLRVPGGWLPPRRSISGCAGDGVFDDAGGAVLREDMPAADQDGVFWF